MFHSKTFCHCTSVGKNVYIVHVSATVSLSGLSKIQFWSGYKTQLVTSYICPKMLRATNKSKIFIQRHKGHGASVSHRHTQPLCTSSKATGTAHIIPLWANITSYSLCMPFTAFSPHIHLIWLLLSMFQIIHVLSINRDSTMWRQYYHVWPWMPGHRWGHCLCVSWGIDTTGGWAGLYRYGQFHHFFILKLKPYVQLCMHDVQYVWCKYTMMIMWHSSLSHFKWKFVNI